jgi:glycosyltransferase involved in cell wall biosynthesis
MRWVMNAPTHGEPDAADVARLTTLKKKRSLVPPFSDHSAGLDDVVHNPLERLLIQMFPAIGDGLSMFIRNQRYDAVITEDFRTALVFGLLGRIFGRSAKHIVKELYFDESVLSSPLRRLLFRAALAKAECFITNCQSEIDVYSEFLARPKRCFHFLPWPSNLPLQDSSEDHGYVFAAGRSFRDWKALFACAEQFRERFVVVASRRELNNLRQPANVELYLDIPHERYVALLRAARVVIVPLVWTVRATGQAAVLEAMSMRKPILTADTPGVLDYVSDGVNGLLYQAGNVEHMSSQLRRLLDDTELRKTLSEGAVCSIEMQFNKAVYSERLLDLAASVAGDKAS